MLKVTVTEKVKGTDSIFKATGVAHTDGGKTILGQANVLVQEDVDGIVQLIVNDDIAPSFIGKHKVIRYDGNDTTESGKLKKGSALEFHTFSIKY